MSEDVDPMKSIRRRLLRPFAVCLLGVACACGDATTPERGGDYRVTVTGPAAHVNGAAVIELAGRGVDTATSIGGGRVFMERLPGDYVRVVVVNGEPGALQFGLRLARGTGMPKATIIEVADGDDQLRTDVGRYTVRFER